MKPRRAINGCAAVRDRFEGSVAQRFVMQLKALDFANQIILLGAGLLISLLPFLILLSAFASERVGDDIALRLGLDRRASGIVSHLFTSSPAVLNVATATTRGLRPHPGRVRPRRSRLFDLPDGGTGRLAWWQARWPPVRQRCLVHPLTGEAPRTCWCFNPGMVVIFGFGAGKGEDLGAVVPTVCPNCHNQVFLHHVRSKKSVRLYFVPVVPYGTDDYLVCPVCSRGLQLSTRQVRHLRSMSAATASFQAGRLSEAQLMVQADLFWRQLGVHPTGQSPAPASGGAVAPAQPGAPVQAAAAPQSASAAQPSPAAADDDAPWIAQLRKLAALHDQGVLSDAAYDAAKRRVISQE